MYLEAKDKTTQTIEDNSAIQKFRAEVLIGLKNTPKRLDSKYFYDAEGDKLFQQIMAAPEYYLTRCELDIFQNKTNELTGTILSDANPFDLVELGAGDATKSAYLLKALSDKKAEFTYMPIDISGHILEVLNDKLKKQVPGLNMVSLEGEYLQMLGKAMSLSKRRKVVMFLGSNIGNMHPNDARLFCLQLRDRLQPGDILLIGFDLKKNPEIILNAYNDKAGITRQFNLNLLTRINRELGGNFNLQQFEHYETYDPDSGACKSYLVSLADLQVAIGDVMISFTKDEVIFTEISQKYSPEDIEGLASATGFKLIRNCTDSKGWFIDSFWQAI